MGWLERVLSMNGQLQGRERSKRKIAFIVSLTNLVSTLIYLSAPGAPLVTMLCAMVFAVASGFILVVCICHKPLRNIFLKCQVVAWCVAIALLDLHRRSTAGEPVWPLMILLADLSLVLRLGKRFATAVIGIASFWVAVSILEMTFRFGLFDVPGTASKEDRWEAIHPMCDCSDPPCKLESGGGLRSLAFSLSVLIIDFFTTRGFAAEVETEQLSMVHTIRTVEAIAQLLARYDVDTVAEMLPGEAVNLPQALHHALQQLEQNLRMYRPYLPQSCFEGAEAQAETQSVTDLSFSSSHSEISSEVVPADLGVARRLGDLQKKRACALVVNVRGSLALLEEDPAVFAGAFGSLLQVVLNVVQQQRGVADLFVGDRIFASFNTSRQCPMHACSALRTAQMLSTVVDEVSENQERAGLTTSTGVAVGQVQCGDMGCANMRRFSLIGDLMSVVMGLERAARVFNRRVVLNVAANRDAEHEFGMLLLPRLVDLVRVSKENVISLGAGETGNGLHPVYELLVFEQLDPSLSKTEWMYSLGLGFTKWTLCSEAVRIYIDGGTPEAAVEHAKEHGSIVRMLLQEHRTRTPLVVQI